MLVCIALFVSDFERATAELSIGAKAVAVALLGIGSVETARRQRRLILEQHQRSVWIYRMDSSY